MNRTWLLGLIMFVVISQGCEKRRRPDRFLIPSGYIGYIRVDFSVKGAPPLLIEEGYDLIQIPPNGRLKTSSRYEAGIAKDEFYYVSATGRRRLPDTGPDGGGMIWDGGTGQEGSDSQPMGNTNLQFFIGTESDYKQLGNINRIGPLKKATPR